MGYCTPEGFNILKIKFVILIYDIPLCLNSKLKQNILMLLPSKHNKSV